MKIGAKVVRHARYITFQLAEVATLRSLFANILRLIDGLRPAPIYRHDDGPSSILQIARQDRCVPRRSKCALTVRNGHGAEFLIAQSARSRATAYRDSSGPESRSDAHCATIIGDWEEPSGESLLRTFVPSRRGRPCEKPFPISREIGAVDSGAWLAKVPLE